MLIMPSTSKNFQVMAEGIANDFFNKGTPLTDGIAKVAKEKNMVPEEVKRLVEKSNTAASIMHLKSAEDKKSTFKLASVEDVLNITHPTEDEPIEEAPQEKTASVFPNTRKSVYMEKAAACCERDCTSGKFVSPGKVSEKKDNPIPEARRMKDKLQLEKKACAMYVDGVIAKLCNQYKGRDTSAFSKLAADASILYGDKVETLLQVVAENIGAPTTFDKTAGIINDTTKDMQMLKKAAENIDKIYELSDNIKQIDTGIQEIMENVQGTVL